VLFDNIQFCRWSCDYFRFQFASGIRGGFESFVLHLFQQGRASARREVRISRSRWEQRRLSEAPGAATRPPDYETENRALVALAQALADSPRTVLQTLADAILELLQSDSAGISLLTKDEKRFYWPAIAGVWKPHIGGGTPRNFGPCGDVLDRNIPLMFRHVERRYNYFVPVKPAIEECLLVPFYVQGKAVGTIWAIAHSDRRKFDVEDMRQLVSLGRFTSSAYRVIDSLDLIEKHAATLRENEHRSREMIDALPAAIYTTDVEGRLLHFNRACIELSGRTPVLGSDYWCVSW
jgi:PAS domain-containing protein